MNAELLTADETASLLRLNVKRVQALARSGDLPAVRRGRRWLFSRAAVLGQLTPAKRVRARRTASATRSASAKGVNISARNQLRGRILSILADGVMAEVRIAIGDQELVSIITRNSVERLGLRKGDEVLAVIKSTEVMIATEAGSASE